MVDGCDIETAHERAQRRVAELAHAVGGVLETLAAIYRDEDWRYLHDRAGEPYQDFAGFVRDQLGGSESNARRYRQGVETLVVPLLEVAGPGTRIPVTPNDVAALGLSGAAKVIAAAPEQLAGVHTGEVRTAVLRELIDSVISERHRNAATPISGIAELPPALPTPLPHPPDPTAPATDHDSTEPPPDRPAAPPCGDGRREHADGPDQNDAATPAVSAAASAVSASSEQLSRNAAATTAGGSPTADVDAARELHTALTIVLRLDPASTAGSMRDASDATQIANDCAMAAQRLARLSKLLTLR
jgi:hypothetical protein